MKLTASVAASGISSSRGSSRDKDRLRFLKNASAAKIVAALLDSDPVDQVDRSLQNLLQRIPDLKEFGRAWLGIWLKFDEKVCVAALGVKVLTSGGRTEDVQSRNTKAAAQLGKGLSLAADGGVHGRILKAGQLCIADAL